MYTHYSLIKGLIIKDNEGKIEFQEDFNLNDEKVIIPKKKIKKLECELSKCDELIFLDEEYNFEEVNIVNCKKIVNLPKNLKIVNNEIHFP